MWCVPPICPEPRFRVDIRDAFEELMWVRMSQSSDNFAGNTVLKYGVLNFKARSSNIPVGKDVLVHWKQHQLFIPLWRWPSA
jgi:hypothetical protein